MSYTLSAGIAKRFSDGNPNDDYLLTTLLSWQVVSVKRVDAVTGPVRYRFILSDGETAIQAMLATQLNHLVEEDHLRKNTVITTTQLSLQAVGGRRLLIILALDSYHNDAEKIGSPLLPNHAKGETTTGSNNPASPVRQATSQGGGSSSSNASRPPQGRFSGTVFPIEGLNPYQNNYTIRVRVTQKSEIKNWSNARGEGKLFNVTFADESGEIRGTAFNKAVDALYDKLQEGRVYWLSKARINLAKKKFSNIQNDYELSLEAHTEIEECHDVVNMPMMKFDFKTISELNDVAPDATCDVIGVVKEVGPTGTVVGKASNREITKREITIVDSTLASVRITLWGKQATDFNVEDGHPVIAFKGVKVSDYGGRSLSLLSSSQMLVDPDIEASHQLRGWYDEVGHGREYTAQSSAGPGAGSMGGFNRNQIKSFMQVKDEKLGESDAADFFSQRGTIMHIMNESMMYPACNTPSCNKKVTEGGDGTWRCEKCSKSWDTPQYRYIMSVVVADATSQLWLQAFNEAGEIIFKMTASDLQKLQQEDETRYAEVLKAALGKTFNFSCKAKTESYNETSRVRYTISRMAPLDFGTEVKEMMKLLTSPWAS